MGGFSVCNRDCNRQEFMTKVENLTARPNARLFNQSIRNWIGKRSFISNVGTALLMLGLPLYGAEFTVLTTNLSGPGSLPEAIASANLNPGKDRILFNLPGDGVRVIQFTNPLAALTDSVEIDGFSQPESAPNTELNSDNAVRLVELDGLNQTIDGLILAGGDSTVRGLRLRRFARAIAIQSSGNVVVGCHIGFEPTNPADPVDLALGNDFGILLGGSCCSNIVVCCNRIGGSEFADRNVMVQNRRNSIRVGEDGSHPVEDTLILGNFIGVDSSGLRGRVLIGFSGISLRSATRVTVGGEDVRSRNIMTAGLSTSAQAADPGYGSGVSIRGASRDIRIVGNHIGVGTDGVTPLLPIQNVGVTFETYSFTPYITVPVHCRIEGNRIANTGVGVGVFEMQFGTNFTAGKLVTVLSNTMTSIGISPIWLGAATRPNDPGDVDVGANDRQNHPEISDAVFTNGNTLINGLLRSKPDSTYILEIYSSPSNTVSGNGGAELFRQRIAVTTDAGGAATFSVVIPGVDASSRFVTATATDAEGNTSLVSPALEARSIAPVVFVQPVDRGAPVGMNAVFFATASGAQPMSVQWRFQGQAIPGATNLSLLLTNVQPTAAGLYDIVFANAFGSATSRAARLTVGIRPVIIQHPVSQSVASNQSVTLSVGVSNSATLPLLYIWRSNLVIVASELSNERTAFYKSPPLRSNANYIVVVSNAYTAPVASRSVTVNVLTDRDGDGLPDVFENHFGFDPNNPADSGLDSDGDGRSNREEYLSGTSPVDASNQLRIQRITTGVLGAVVEFFAVSNKTYALQYRDTMVDGSWLPLQSLPARETNRMEYVMDAESHSARFYRVVTPSE